MRAGVDSSSAALAVGDVVVVLVDGDTFATTTKAIPAALQVAGRAWGIALEAAEPGTRCDFGRGWRISPAVTGLAAEAGYARVGTDARAERVDALELGDYSLGRIDDEGWLYLDVETTIPVGQSLASSDTVTVADNRASLAEPFAGRVVSLDGSNRGAAINAAIVLANATYLATGRKRVVRLLAGDYALETAVTMLGGVHLLGAGSLHTRLTTTMAPLVGRADDPTNYLIGIRGALSGSVSTTLTAHARPGTSKINVASAAGISAGTKLRIHGNNNVAADMPGMSDGGYVILTEVVEVASIAGTTLTLTRPLAQWHTSGLPVVSVTTIDNVAISGIDLACDGGTIAVGIQCEYARNVTLEDIRGAGFSRALIERRLGCSESYASDIHSRGENNSILYNTTIMRFEDKRITSSPTGLRSHPNGVPRGLLTYRSRCTEGKADFDLYNGGCGLRLWGGIDLHFRGTIHGMNCTGVTARDPERGDGDNIGAGVDCGASSIGPTGLAEFGMGCSFDIQLYNCLTSGIAAECGWYHHDHWSSQVKASIVNTGPGDTQVVDGVTYHSRGMTLGDVFGGNLDLFCKGVSYGMRLRATTSLETRLVFDGQSGDVSYPGAYPVYWETAAQLNANPRFRVLHVVNGLTMPVFTPVFEAAPDWNLRFDAYNVTSYDITYAPAIVARNPVTGSGGVALALGDLVRLVPGDPGERRVNRTTGPARGCAAVCMVGSTPGAATTGLVMMTPAGGTGWVMCTTAAVEVGDALVGSATAGRAEADNAPSDPSHVLGIALTSKAAGTQGLVQFGPR